MKKAILFPILLFATSLFAQDPCDDLNFVSIQYSPFTDTTINVHVENAGAEIFSYPGFVLLAPNGDTLAKEMVNYFGIGAESVHTLNVRDGVHDPLTDFMGSLELHTGFYDVLACDWQLNQSLCADTPCDSLVIGFQNWGGALVLGDFHWTLDDDMGTLVDSGSFNMEANQQYWLKGLCVEPGTYTYSMTPLGSPSGGGPTLTASTSTAFASPTISEPLDWFNQPGAELEIPFYNFCVETPNSIVDPNKEAELKLIYDNVTGTLTCEKSMERVQVYSANGQLLLDENPNSTSMKLDGFPPALYLMIAETESVRISTKAFLK